MELKQLFTNRSECYLCNMKWHAQYITNHTLLWFQVEKKILQGIYQTVILIVLDVSFVLFLLRPVVLKALTVQIYASCISWSCLFFTSYHSPFFSILDNVFRVIREDFETKKWWMEMVMCVFALLSPDNWAPQLGLGNDSYLCFFFLSRKHMKLWQSRNSRTVKVCMQFYICNFFVNIMWDR